MNAKFGVGATAWVERSEKTYDENRVTENATETSDEGLRGAESVSLVPVLIPCKVRYNNLRTS